MTATTQLPKLSTLSPEQRRILCAEALGWTEIHEEEAIYLSGGSAGMVWVGKWPDFPYGDSQSFPDPDLNASDALALVDKLGESDWIFESTYYTVGINNGDFRRKASANSDNVLIGSERYFPPGI